MGNLTNKYVKDTYDGLIKLTDETQGVKATPQPLQDGLGNDLPIQVSTTEVLITGSLEGTASYADNSTSSSYAVTASFALNVTDDIYVSGATFDSASTGILSLQRTGGESDVTVDLDGRYVTLTQGQSESLRLDFLEASTASLNAYTASQGDIRSDFNSYTSSNDSRVTAAEGQIVNNGIEIGILVDQTGSYATTGSNVFTGQQQINNDVIIQGNLYVSGSETIISSSTLIVGDREIELNANRTVGNAGIIVYDVISPETTGSLQYDATNNHWIIGQYGSETRVIDSSITGSMTVLSSSYSQISDNSISSSYADYAATSGPADSSLRVAITAKNMSAGPIYKGTPCYITGSGTNGNLVGVWPADASNPDRMPAGVVLNEDLLSTGDEGEALVVGYISGVDTSAFASGDNVWVAVGGGYTNERPTGSNVLVQKLGNVEKVHASNGSGVITGPGRANDVPNIQEGYFWAGDSDGVAQAITTGSFARRDEENTFSENQIINGSVTINAQDISPFTITSGSSNITVQMGEFGGATQPEIIFTGDNSFFAATNNFVVSADANMDVRSNGGNATLQSNNNTANVYAGDKIILSGSNQLNVDTSNVTITDSATTIQGTAEVNGTTTVNGQLNVNPVSNTAINIVSGSQSIQLLTNESGGTTYPTLYFQGDNAYFQATGQFTIENAPGGVGTGSIAINTNGDFNVNSANYTANTGVVTTKQLRLSGGAGYDLVVTGSANVSSIIDAGSVVRAGSTSGYFSAVNAYALASVNSATGDQMGVTVDNAAYGNTGWSGPGIWVDDPAGNYPVLIGFQNKASWTDGRITLLKNTDISGSLNVTGASNFYDNVDIASGYTFNSNGTTNLNGATNADGGISTTTGNLNLSSATYGISLNANVFAQNDVYVNSGNLYGRDILLDDPGATTSFVLNPNVFSEYEGQAFRWVEGSRRVAWFTAEDTFDWFINGWDTVSNTYDKATKIIQDSNGFQIQSLDYKGSSTFVTRLQLNGDEKISFPDGLNVTGSIAQQPHSISISSATASIDFSESNIQTLTLASGTATHLIPTNMVAGQSVVVEITQDASSAGTVTIEGSITFPGGTDYTPTTTLGGKDVLTLVTFDGSTARAVGQNDFS